MRLVLLTLLLLWIPTAALAAPAPPTQPSRKGGASADEPRAPRVSEPGRRPKKKAAKKKKKRSKEPQSAVRIYAGGALRTTQRHPFAPGTYFMVGGDYEQPLFGGLTYAPSLRYFGSAADFTALTGGVNLRFVFGRQRASVLPYVLAGAGVATAQHGGTSSIGAELRAGAGLSYRVLPNFRLGLELGGSYLPLATKTAGKQDDFSLFHFSIVPELRF